MSTMVASAVTEAQLEVVLASDLFVGGAPTKDTLRRTRDHLPGSVIRGAFAAAWLRQRLPKGTMAVPSSGPLREEFLALFEGGIRFGPAYAGAGPAPISLLRHKYRPGPACIPTWDQADSINGQRGRDGLRCLTCQQALEPSKGEIAGPATTRRGHTERNADGTPVHGRLFSREAIRHRPAGGGLPRFTGSLVASDRTQLALLRKLQPGFGGRRTSHGLAEVTITEAPSSPPELRDGRFVMVLNSPGIFVDDDGYPRRSPAASELARSLGLPESGVRIVQTWSRWGEEAGWHAASGLPKPNEIVAAAGSTYLVEAPEASPEGMRRLWQRGLGLRRHEGFGDLR